MYPVSAAYETAISQLARRFTSKIITDSETITVENIKSIDLSESVNDTDPLNVGSCCMAALNTELYNYTTDITGKEITPYIGLDIGSDSPEYVPLGVFIVSDCKRSDTRTITITAKDKMSLFDVNCTVTVSDSILTIATGSNTVTLSVDTATLLDWCNALCSLTGCTLATTSFPNVSFIPGLTFAGSTTLRVLLSYIAQATGCFARFNRVGQLELKWYAAADKTITARNYIKLTISNNVVQPINVVSIRAAENSVPTEMGEGSNRYEIIGNPMLYINPGYAITGIYDSIVNFGYTPYQLSMQGDPAIQAGDIVTVTNVAGDSQTYPIMSHHLSYSGGVKSDLQATGSTNPEKVSVTEKIQALNRKTNELEISDESTRSTISQIQTDLGARATVEQVSQIEQTVAGIDTKVSIRGGYNLLQGTAAYDTENWNVTGDVDVIRNDPLVYDTGARGAFVLSGAAILLQQFFTVPGEQYCFMFRYLSTGATYTPGTATVAETEIPLPQVEKWTVCKGSFVAAGTQNTIMIQSTAGKLYIADLIVMYGLEVTAWQQGQNEIITSGYRYTNGRLIIYGTEDDPLQTEITNSAVTVKDENTNEVKWHVSVGGVELDKTVVRERLEVQAKSTASKAFAVLPQGDGHVYFVIND